MSKATPFFALVVAGLLAGCGDREVILAGERETIRADEPSAALVAATTENRSAPVALGPQSRNAGWTQSHASPNSRVQHAALAAQVSEVWATGIGQGDKRRARITADPVAADGRIFTLDSAATVTATSATGERLWQVDLTPETDRPDQTTGGALALGGGRLYVTSAFGRVVALDPATGEEIWTQRLGNTGTGTPSYYKGLVYLVAGDTTAWAIEADSGRIRWQLDSVSDLNNVMGGAAPAVTDQRVIFSYGSGELQGAFRQGGLRLWNAVIAGKRDGFAIATVDDITAGPVVQGDMAYVGNFSGAFTAINTANGERVWTAPTGASEAAWVVGNAVFFVSDLARLVRLDATTGEQIWSVALPGYVERRRPNKRRDRAYANHGPILAGGQLWVASSDGNLRAFNPVDGALTQTVPIRGGATTAPIVMDGTLYVVSGKGDLHAFR